ncbi:hypothetical protein FJT64_015319 [Amphibalanus amphitrite]|uniref:Uncharacterized protein n=1 Tax=Amphibalanus amphitrite TaxID=1232801 RepID=A0A6A4X4R6_AMPAM|nr:hypothetical protein FJT64_015319 [Amphibalanus amphitrite]
MSHAHHSRWSGQLPSAGPSTRASPFIYTPPQVPSPHPGVPPALCSPSPLSRWSTAAAQLHGALARSPAGRSPAASLSAGAEARQPAGRTGLRPAPRHGAALLAVPTGACAVRRALSTEHPAWKDVPGRSGRLGGDELVALPAYGRGATLDDLKNEQSSFRQLRPEKRFCVKLSCSDREMPPRHTGWPREAQVDSFERNEAAARYVKRLAPLTPRPARSPGLCGRGPPASRLARAAPYSP